MKAPHQCRFSPALFAFLVLTGLAHPQTKPQSMNSGDREQKPGYVFRSSTRLVAVDVIATNSKGEQVTDLRPEDFTLMEDGKTQPIQSFSLIQPETTPAAQSNDLQHGVQLPPGVVTNTPQYQATRSWNIVLLDALNSPVIDQSAMRDRLIAIVDHLPEQPVAIYVLADRLRLLQDFSSDPATLKQTLAALKNTASARLDNNKGGHEMERYSPVFINSLPRENLESLLRFEAQGTEARTDSRINTTAEALNMLVKHLAALPGRKNLIWVGEGFPFSIDPGSIVSASDVASKREMHISVPSTANVLLEGQVAVYPVDTRGVTGNDAYDAAGRGTDAMGLPETQVGVQSTVSEIYNAQNATHASMNELAERTGGRAFYNTNDIGDAIMRSIDDGRIYYALSYKPQNEHWNGKFRHISVRVNRPGIKLRYRSGYFATDPRGFTLQTQAEQIRGLQNAMSLATPVSTDLLFDAGIIAPSEKTRNLVIVNFAIRSSGISFEQSDDGTHHARVECAVEAFSEKGEPVKSDATKMDADLPPDVFAKVRERGFPCRQALELPPGNYRLRLGVRDNVTGSIGTAETTVLVAGGSSH